MENKHLKFNKLIKYLLFYCSIAILLLFVFQNAYARYRTKINKNAEMEVANMICEIEVQSIEDSSVVNPYCIVHVKNYDKNNVITSVDLDYKIEIIPKDDIILPDLYWENAEGQIISYSTIMNGEMGFEDKEIDEYKVVFLNSGERDITRLVDFNLVAVQAENE